MPASLSKILFGFSYQSISATASAQNTSALRWQCVDVTIAARRGGHAHGVASLLAPVLVIDPRRGAAFVQPSVALDDEDAADFVGDYRASGWMLGIGSTLTAVF